MFVVFWDMTPYSLIRNHRRFKELTDLIIRVLNLANCEYSQFISIRNPVSQHCSQSVTFAADRNLLGTFLNDGDFTVFVVIPV